MQRSLSNSLRLSPRATPARRRRVSSWTPLGVLLLLLACLPLSATGCCSEELPTVLPAPPIPAGRPDPSLDASLLKRQAEFWAYDSPILGMVVVPIDDLTLLLELKEGWRAWALALVAGGRWR